jgi:hypothetical protein
MRTNEYSNLTEPLLQTEWVEVLFAFDIVLVLLEH